MDHHVDTGGFALCGWVIHQGEKNMVKSHVRAPTLFIINQYKNEAKDTISEVSLIVCLLAKQVVAKGEIYYNVSFRARSPSVKKGKLYFHASEFIRLQQGLWLF